MTILPPPLPPIAYSVYRRVPGGVWRPISRMFATEEQAERYKAELPTDWQLEVQEVRTEELPR